MKKAYLTSVVLSAALAAAPAMSAEPADKLRIGVLTTLSGGGAVLGEDLKRGWELGVDVVGGKIGGLETEVIIADDQVKPDIAVDIVQRMVSQDKVDIVAGILWANVMLAVKKPVLDSGAILLSTNSAPPQIAGAECHPHFMAVSWQNNQYAEATALLAESENVKNAYVLAPNYQAGRDSNSSFEQRFGGEVVESVLFKLGQTDFQAELSELRVRKPESAVIFAPAGMGIAFIKQWHGLGMSKRMPLYPINMVDYATLPALGEAAVGLHHVSVYDPSSTSKENVEFVTKYKEKYGLKPTQYALQAYDAVLLLDKAIRDRGGDISDKTELIRAMRAAKYVSPRGEMVFNNNNIPIQNWHKLVVQKTVGGELEIVKVGTVVNDFLDSFHEECKLEW